MPSHPYVEPSTSACEKLKVHTVHRDGHFGIWGLNYSI